MGSIATGQSCTNFKRSTKVCGNCQHEDRKPIVGTGRSQRKCTKNGWFVLMSSTCDAHEYRDDIAARSNAREADRAAR